MKFYFFLFLFLIIFSVAVNAVGMAVNHFNDQFDFQPNFMFEKEYTLAGDKEANVTLYWEGRLSDYVQVEPSYVIGGGNIKLKLTLPEELEGGLHTLKVCGMEVPKEAGMFNVQYGVCDLINVRSMYEGKRLEKWNFAVGNVDLTDENVVFSVTADNWGKTDIDMVYADIRVYDIENKQIGTTRTETKSVPSAQAVTVNGYLKNDLQPGNYWAEAEFYWDEGSDKKNTTFTVGSAIVKVHNITQEFYAEEVNLVDIYIKNGFKGQADNIYLTLEVAGNNLRSSTMRLSPFEMQKVTLPWDTRGLEVNDYKARVIIYQSDKELNREEFTLTVKEREKPINWGLWIAVVSAIVITTGIILFFVLKRKKLPEQNL